MRFKKIKRRLILCLLSMFVVSSPAVQASDYPAKPILLVNPSGVGGATDLIMRAVTSVASNHIEQPIIVQIKAGGGGVIGTEFVAKAAADGYTLLCGGPNWNSTLPAIEGTSKGPDDLLAVCRINYTSGIILVRSDSPFKTYKEMIEWAKANPGKLVFGNRTLEPARLSWKSITQKTGIKTRVVPHDGGGPMLIALLGGQVQVAGYCRPRALPTSSRESFGPWLLAEKPDPDLPDVPTETGRD